MFQSTTPAFCLAHPPAAAVHAPSPAPPCFPRSICRPSAPPNPPPTPPSSASPSAAPEIARPQSCAPAPLAQPACQTIAPLPRDRLQPATELQEVPPLDCASQSGSGSV